jgi:hypothetical protein
MANQDCRCPSDLKQEAMQQCLVSRDGHRPPVTLCAAETGQVDGEHAAGAVQRRSYRRPGSRRPPETVHAYHQRPAGGPAVVHIVD